MTRLGGCCWCTPHVLIGPFASRPLDERTRMTSECALWCMHAAGWLSVGVPRTVISCWQLLVGADARQASTAALPTPSMSNAGRFAEISLLATFSLIQTVAKGKCEAKKVCLGPTSSQSVLSLDKDAIRCIKETCTGASRASKLASRHSHLPAHPCPVSTVHSRSASYLGQDVHWLAVLSSWIGMHASQRQPSSDQ
jgi:hypothetical protein